MTSVTVERLRRVLEENKRLAAGTTSVTREELERVLAENERLRNAGW